MSTESPSTQDPPRRAFTDEYQRCAEGLHLWFYLQLQGGLRGRLTPEDLIQETWCRAYQAFARFDPARGSFRSFLFGIGEKVLLEELRRLARRPGRQADLSPSSAGAPLEVSAAMTSISEKAARSEFVAALLEVAAGICATERQLLIWRGIEELPFAELGRRLQEDPEALRSRWRRLRSRLEISLRRFAQALPGAD